MEIKGHSRAVAGEQFEVYVHVENRSATLIVAIWGKHFIEKRFDCPDPPCHEKVSLLLPKMSKGYTLSIRLRGEDPSRTKQIEVVVE